MRDKTCPPEVDSYLLIRQIKCPASLAQVSELSPPAVRPLRTNLLYLYYLLRPPAQIMNPLSGAESPT